MHANKPKTVIEQTNPLQISPTGPDLSSIPDFLVKMTLLLRRTLLSLKSKTFQIRPTILDHNR